MLLNKENSHFKLSMLHINIICLIFTVIHFCIVFFHTPEYSICDDITLKITFISIKVLSFFLIFVFWKLISEVIIAILTKNKTKIEFILFALLYFVINVIILKLTYPYFHTMDRAFTDTYYGMLNWNIYTWPSYFQSLFFILNYNIFPSFMGISIVNDLIYSLIFAFIITKTKQIYNNKLYLLLFIPFFIPMILGLNQSPQRFVISGWLLLFIFFFIFINRGKEINNIYTTIFLSVISIIAIILRHEYIFLLFLFPIVLIATKIFTRKNIIIYSIILFISFIGLYTLEKTNNDNYYEVHNVTFIYDDYILNNSYNLDIENNKEILNKVYRESMKDGGLPSSSFSYDMQDSNDVKTVCSVLIKYAIIKSPHFIRKNIAKITPYNYLNLTVYSGLEDLIRTTANDNIEIPSPIKVQKAFPKKISYLLICFNTKCSELGFANFIYCPQLSFFLLLCIFTGTFIRKNIFYTCFLIGWLSILFIILTFMYWNFPLYFWAFFINTRVFFFIWLIDILSNFPIKNKLKQA